MSTHRREAGVFTPLIRGLSFPESPRWEGGRLWFSDIRAASVHAVTLEGAVETVAHVAGEPSGLGWLPDGRLLIVSSRDRRILRRNLDGSVACHADLSRLTPWALNEMVVDGSGRAYVGNYGYDYHGGGRPAPTNLILVEPDGTARALPVELRFPNGMVVSDDGARLLVAESSAGRITEFAVDSRSRTWAELPARRGEGPGVPDGICQDAEGALWIADAAHRRLLRVSAGGTVLDEHMLVDGVFACALGGPAGQTLFVCTSPLPVPGSPPLEGKAAIVMTVVDVPGVRQP
jgi:sugar lactone lactonase YvrE